MPHRTGGRIVHHMQYNFRSIISIADCCQMFLLCREIRHRHYKLLLVPLQWGPICTISLLAHTAADAGVRTE